jgi:hypothetical protein
MRLADYVSMNFNNNMPTAAVFLDIEKTFDTTWNCDILNKLSELEFSISLIELLASFITERKCKDLADGEFSTPRKIAVGVPQGSSFPSTAQSIHK